MTIPSGQEVPLPQLSSRDRGGVTVVSLRGELDLCASSALDEHLSDIRRHTRPRNVADLTALAFIDCACLAVLVRHSQDIRSQGGSFALAGPQQGAVHRILTLTGLMTWFEVHDTVEEAASWAPVTAPTGITARRVLARRIAALVPSRPGVPAGHLTDRWWRGSS